MIGDLFDEADTNYDGRLDYDEFCKYEELLENKMDDDYGFHISHTGKQQERLYEALCTLAMSNEGPTSHTIERYHRLMAEIPYYKEYFLEQDDASEEEQSSSEGEEETDHLEL